MPNFLQNTLTPNSHPLAVSYWTSFTSVNIFFETSPGMRQMDIYTFLEPLFCVLQYDKTHSATREDIAYATMSCQISQGLELKKPSMWQKESAIVLTLYIIFCSPKITNLHKQQARKAATSESNEGCIQK